MSSRLVIAGAGSGKTTFLVDEALKCTANVLITTFTEANEAEIKRKLIEKRKCIPANITVQTWFSFLLQHGARPYQGLLINGRINGLVLVNAQSGFRYKVRNGHNVYWKEDETEKHYFTNDRKIYSDKLAKFVIRCCEKSDGEVINRLSKIYPSIFIDEVQDLAGYDLEIVKLLLASPISVSMVGDPRQVTYVTHYERKYGKYKHGLIKEFVECECNGLDCDIDESSLRHSYRNCEAICDFTSKLYPEYYSCESLQRAETEHDGIYLVRPSDFEGYCRRFKPQVLRYQKSLNPELNFGFSKGLGFDRVLIWPTKKIEEYLLDGDLTNIASVKAKFYVAATRARYSVAIVHNHKDDVSYIEGVKRYTGT